MRKNTNKPALKTVTIRLAQEEIDYLLRYSHEISLPGEGSNISRAARTVIATARSKGQRR